MPPEFRFVGTPPDGASWTEADLATTPAGAQQAFIAAPCPNCGSNKVSWYFRAFTDVPDNPVGVSCAKCGHEDMNLS